MPRSAALALGLALSLCNALRAHAQSPAAPDSAQRAAVMANAMQLSKPADFVLRHQAELALDAAQVTALTALAAAQRDSVIARQARMMAAMQEHVSSPAMVAAVGWTGEVDEQAMRDAMCAQSAVQAEFMIGYARDRRAVSALLTPAQMAQLPHLQTADLLQAIKRL